MAFASKTEAMIACETALIRFKSICPPRAPGDSVFADEKYMLKTFDPDADGNGTLLLSYKVGYEDCHIGSCMHGGSVSALIDYTNCWNASMFAKDGRYHPSTFNSRSLNLAFLKPIHMGTTVRVRSRPVSIGKTMAYCETTVESLDGKIIYATGQHHFYCFPQGPESVKKLQAEFEASMEQAKRNLQSGPSL